MGCVSFGRGTNLVMIEAGKCAVDLYVGEWGKTLHCKTVRNYHICRDALGLSASNVLNRATVLWYPSFPTCFDLGLKIRGAGRRWTRLTPEGPEYQILVLGILYSNLVLRTPGLVLRGFRWLCVELGQGHYFAFTGIRWATEGGPEAPDDDDHDVEGHRGYVHEGLEDIEGIKQHILAGAPVAGSMNAMYGGVKLKRSLKF